MVDLLITNEWQSMKEIALKQKELGIKDTKDVRRFRKCVARYNALYDGHDHDKYVVHKNGKGYKITSNKDEIRTSMNDLKKRGVTMLKAYNRTAKSLGLSQLERLDI